MTSSCAAKSEQLGTAVAVNENPVIDLRKLRGRIWSWGSEDIPATTDIDQWIYRGFLERGQEFLAGVKGRFGVVCYDVARRQIFLCRDWVGEVPLHYYLAEDSIVVANSIADIREHVGPERFRYAFVRAVPHSHALLIDSTEMYRAGTTRRRSFRVRQKTLWCDFAARISSAHESGAGAPHVIGEQRLRLALEDAVRERLESWPAQSKVAVLLSGGIDSLCVAYLAKKIRPSVVAYTLEAGDGGEDAVRAQEIAAVFGMPIRVVHVDPEEFVLDYANAVAASEVYHLPNVYCAAGMRFLGRALHRDTIEVAFCGEGVNEAIGDYHDWIVEDPRDGSHRVLQCVDDTVFAQVAGRLRYVWGRPDTGGRYNFQLGSGLAKHGISRMVKPMLAYGVQLECPWLDIDVMAKLVSIPGDQIQRVGGKPGLMAQEFRRDIEIGEIPAHFILESRKTRLQDAIEHGRGGLTGHLLAAGFDQSTTLEMFNRSFGAHLDPVLDSRRLTNGIF